MFVLSRYYVARWLLSCSELFLCCYEVATVFSVVLMLLAVAMVIALSGS